MGRSAKRKRDKAEAEDAFSHASEHVDLDALLSEHLGGTKAAESVVERIDSQRRTRDERTARRGF
jgi:hypothetical protein